MRLETFFQRLILPALLAVAGLASLIYGAAFHVAAVTEQQEVEETIEIPSAFGAPPGEVGDFALEDPGAMGGGPFMPPPMTTNVKRRIFITADTPEPTLLWEITFGGLTRLETGELKRIYTGDAPSLCPS